MRKNTGADHEGGGADVASVAVGSLLSIGGTWAGHEGRLSRHGASRGAQVARAES